MYKNKKQFINSMIKLTCLSGALFLYSAGVYAADLPTNGSIVAGNGMITSPSGNVMNVSGLDNTIIKWGSFDIGMQNTVNFTGSEGFNVLNYVNGGNMSTIYGTLNGVGGNVYLVNPAGVFIGGSANIDVGSLYVSNRKIEALENGSVGANPDIEQLVRTAAPATGAELMSLGYISANKITFDGDRVVLNTERLIDANREQGELMQKLGAENVHVITTDKEKVLIGYDAYDAQKGYNLTEEEQNTKIAMLQVRDEQGNLGEETALKASDGYMWINTLEQLQAMNTNLSGKYALLGGIDATLTEEDGKSFLSIGDEENPFTGVLDGLSNPHADKVDFAIFDLHINGDGDNVGLFGVTDGAKISNLLLSYGNVSGGSNVGAVVGLAKNTEITDVRNSVDVSGTTNVGGIVGKAENSVLSHLENSGSIQGTTATSSAIGGIAGELVNSSLNTATNYGKITGVLNAAVGSDTTANVGGLIGHYNNTDIAITLSDLHNEMEVLGGYNVGGIIGSAEGVLNLSDADNISKVTAQGYTLEKYTYEGQKGTTLNVKGANAGGIIGAASGSGELSDLENSGDVQSVRIGSNNFYQAGNIGGIAGKLAGTGDGFSLNNVKNSEDQIYGAHNVGGVVGFMENTQIALAINSGEVMGTGARAYASNTMAKEQVSGESFIIGNIGGIVGYAHGKNFSINQAGNFGDVHTLAIENNNVTEASQAANVGGIIGHASYANSEGAISMDELREIADDGSAMGVISNSYNAGDVRGYTGVGGIAGLMHNGGIVHSYNVGAVNTTRTLLNNSGDEALNLGGILGDSTVGTKATTQLYDVYNTGELGDKNYVYGQRHIGGIVGRNSGDIEKAYNTGNIYNTAPVIGGIVGSFIAGSIKNSFNTGTLNTLDTDAGGIVGSINIGNGAVVENVYNLGDISASAFVGGIIGTIGSWNYTLSKENSLTVNNAYNAGKLTATLVDIASKNHGGAVNYGAGKFYGGIRQSGYFSEDNGITINNVYYITQEDGSDNVVETAQNAKAITIAYADAMQGDSYSGLNFGSEANPNDGDWRLYEGSTLPILNAFLPTLADASNSDALSGLTEANRYHSSGMQEEDANAVGTVQFGTASNPMQTIITFKPESAGSFELNWADAGLKKNESLQVNNGDLTLNDFNTHGNYFGGTLEASGALTVNNNATAANQDILLGSMANLSGNSITLNSGADLVNYGNLVSSGDIVVNAAENITLVGKLQAGTESNAGNITLSAANGSVTANLGVKENGLLAANGELLVNAGTSIYLDSDLHITGDIKLSANDEIVLDASNIGVTDEVEEEAERRTVASFISYYNQKTEDAPAITMEGAEIKIFSLDFWDEDSKTYDFNKYGSELTDLLDNTTNINGSTVNAMDILHVWVSSADQLAAIGKSDEAMKYNFALKNDIDASVISDYTEIGTLDNAYSGNFDGRNNKIIGLNVQNSGSAGIFGYNEGTIANLQIISSNFEGAVVGSVAAVNMDGGTIKNITTFGNRVASTGYVDLNNGNGEERLVAAAGGAVGINSGLLSDLNLNDNVLANAAGDADKESYAGGAAGLNQSFSGAGEASLVNAIVNSAVTTTQKYTTALGGVVGLNAGSIEGTESLGIVNGSYHNTTTTENVGGIVGVNYGEINNAYNLAYVDGTENVGGIVGASLGGSISNISNGGLINSVTITEADGSVTEGKNVGGIAGLVQNTEVTQGRNSGDITGVNNVGGMFGSVDENSSLMNIVNDGFVNIVGQENVGGVVGYNNGKINAEQMGLVNNGVISGNKYVGGVAGYNAANGEIIKSGSNITLNVVGENAEYFGGVVGYNEGLIENATNTGRIMADKASYVGGIVGYNAEQGKLQGASNSNSGVVIGGQYVGGVVGYNKGAVDGVAEEGSTAATVIKNSGLVMATMGGAGGIFGVNDIDSMEYVTLVNSGVVLGNTHSGDVQEGSGGIASVNHANISHSTIVGSVAAVVADNMNAGGLFGVNYGDLIGARDENDNYYKYGVYNNGAVIGMEMNLHIEDFVDMKRDQVINTLFEKQKEQTTLTNVNVGGLVGVNAAEATISAAYNTGSVFGGTNVGGIAGSNAGTLSEVFNSVAAVSLRASDGTPLRLTEGSIIGVDNVGGVVGLNSGLVDYAYNLTDVDAVTALNPDSVYGNLVGMNDGTVQHSYALNESGTLIGGGNNALASYTFAEGDSTANYISADERTSEDAYAEMTQGSEREIWRFYEGYSTPLLKTFLTKVYVNSSATANKGESETLQFTADEFATLQNNGVSALIPGVLATEHPEDFAHYELNKDLIQMEILGSTTYAQSETTVENYMLNLWSQQIALSGTDGMEENNPNLHGYDLVNLAAQVKTVSEPETPETPTIPDVNIPDNDIPGSDDIPDTNIPDTTTPDTSPDEGNTDIPDDDSTSAPTEPETPETPETPTTPTTPDNGSDGSSAVTQPDVNAFDRELDNTGADKQRKLRERKAVLRFVDGGMKILI